MTVIGLSCRNWIEGVGGVIRRRLFYTMNGGMEMATERCLAESSHGKKCRALKCKKCVGHEKCVFYKTAAQQEESIAKVYAHLRSLPAEQQLHIAYKYYSGDCPWQREG